MSLNIHSIFSRVFKIWRAKRMRLFASLLQPSRAEVILDVGGYPATWLGDSPVKPRIIHCLNVHPVAPASDGLTKHVILTLVGDGCALPYADSSYDILFSNSVIEHVGSWDRQMAFAGEVRRVGRKIWVQTPAYECPLEPHFLAPFVHWLPPGLRSFVARWLTPWGWITRPSREAAMEMIDQTRLLSRRQMEQLFPDCKLYTERMLGFIPKSYVAYRL